MIKAIYCIRRKPGMSEEAFHRYWREVHAPIAKKVPGMCRYIQCHRVAVPFLQEDPPFDGAAEVWFDDFAAVERMLSSPECAAARADEANFIDLERAVVMLTEEYPVIP